MPFGAFRLNTLSAAIASSAPPGENTYADGWYFYQTSSGEQLTSLIGDHQIAVMGYNSDFNIRAVLALQSTANNINYLLPIKWNYSTNSWTIGTKVQASNYSGDYTGFTGRKAVSELLGGGGVVDSTNYGLTYTPSNVSHQVIPFSMDSNANIVVGTPVDTGMNSIGTSAEHADIDFDGVISSNPTYVMAGREDGTGYTRVAFTRSGNSLTRINGDRTIGMSSNTTVAGANYDINKANMVGCSQSGNFFATSIGTDGILYNGSTYASGYGSNITIQKIAQSSNFTKYLVLGIIGSNWVAMVATSGWRANQAPLNSLATYPFIMDTTTNIPETGYCQNMRLVAGWDENTAFAFYTRSHNLYVRKILVSPGIDGEGIWFEPEQLLGNFPNNAYSLDIRRVYLDSGHRYFIGMTNATNSENVQGLCSLFAVRAQGITFDTQAKYHIRDHFTLTPNEGTTISLNVYSSINAGETIYWTINHITTNSSDFSATNGSAVINSTGKVIISFNLSNDSSTEGTESFSVQIRTGSISGPIVATSSTYTIQDTSRNAVTSMTYATGATATANSITIPAAAQVGDFCILMDYSTTNSTVVPTGFTQIQTAGTTGIRTTVSYRVLTAGQPGTTITGQGGVNRKVLLVFRPNSPITTVSPTSTGAQATTQTPGSQNLVGEAGPMIAFATYASTGTPTTGWSVGAPTQVSPGLNLYVKFLITNSGTPATTVISTGDAGTNALLSCRVKFV